MSDAKRRSSNAIPLQRGSALPSAKQESLRNVKIECDYLKEKLQKSVIDNPQTAKKAALLIGLWIEGKIRKRKKAG